IGTPSCIRNTLNLPPLSGAIVAPVDARAGAGVEELGIGAVDEQAHDIGIVDHPVVNGSPGATAVGRLPWEMECARVDDPWIARINGKGIEVPQFLVMLGRDALPGFGGVQLTIDAVQSSGYKNVRIGWSHDQSPHRLACKARPAPGAAAGGAAKHPPSPGRVSRP